MKYFIKNCAKVLVDYLIALLVFVIFIYAFMSLAGVTKFYAFLPLYCFIMFVLSFLIIYPDMKAVAIKEKRPQYDLKPYPIKGFLYGLIGFSPIILLEIISVIVVFSDVATERLKHVLINILMGPTYFIIGLSNEAVWAYALASLLIPVVAMLGYLAGYYGFELNKKKKQQLAEKEVTFKKSPWNPTNSATGKIKKKIKKTGSPKLPESQKPL